MLDKIKNIFGVLSSEVTQNKSKVSLQKKIKVLGLFLVLFICGFSMSQCKPADQGCDAGFSPWGGVCARNMDTDNDGLIEISSAIELEFVRNNLAGTSFKLVPNGEGFTGGCPRNVCRGYELMADIDFATTEWGSAYTGADRNRAGWEPIGNCGPDNTCSTARDNESFTGVFEGNGFVIRNLYINRPNVNGVGFFGSVSTSALLNQIALSNIAIRGESYVGGLLGIMIQTTSNHDVVVNSYVTGVVLGDSNIGGLVGSSQVSVSGAPLYGIRNTYSTASVRSETADGVDIGGLIGQSAGIRIENSYATGTVTGSSGVGGLIGLSTGSAINYSYATGLVQKSDGLIGGGLIGEVLGGASFPATTITNSYWDNQTTNHASGVGRGSSTGTTGLTTAQLQVAPETPGSLSLGPCFRLTATKYPQLYTNSVGSSCNTTLLSGPNATR